LSPEVRSENAQKGYNNSGKYKWTEFAKKIYQFLGSIDLK